MCNDNLNLITELDFSSVNDELNWFNTSNNPIATESGFLVLRPDSQLSVFNRGLGQININNNRVRCLLNLEVNRPLAGVDTVFFIVQIWNGTNLVGENSIYIDNIQPGQVVKYSFDRTYEYDQLSGNISIRIKTPLGFQNEIKLKNLKVEDYFFCEEKVRTYFVFEDLFEDSLTAQRAGLKLHSWKEDNIETLTTDFHTHNAINLGGNPLTSWKFANAEPDGSNRVSAASNQNTFNPFVDEFGLVFDVVNSFHGGKPTGTISNQNFGSGVMKLGVEKPEILNANLQRKKGAFFIDIDYSKNLKIEVDVIINQSSSQLYSNPTIYRKYFIVWDSEKCQKEFYYYDQLIQNPQQQNQIQNGFLSGVTPDIKIDTSIPCSQSVNFEGLAGSYTFEVNFGTQTGMCGIQYNASHIPDKFDITWNGITVSTGYVGCNEYNNQLLNAGVPSSQINTTPHPGNGAGQLLFNKTSAFPTTAVITVTGVIGNTGWNFSGICPFEQLFTEITWDDTNTTEDRTGNNINEVIYYGGVNYPVTGAVWQRNNNGSGWVNVSNPVNVTTSFALVAGVNEFRLKATAGGSDVYSNVLKYTRSNVTAPTINSIIFPVINPSTNTVNVGFNVSSDGGSALIEVGVCYSQNQNPTINDAKVILNPVTGQQYTNITVPNDGAWFFGAYAINSVGTTYFYYLLVINL